MRPAKAKAGSSSDLLNAIVQLRRAMIRDNVHYEADYYTTPMSPHDSKVQKLYLMTIGPPGRRDDDRPVAKKVLTAYVGGSRQSTVSRVQEHNRPGSDRADPRTKHGAGHWVMCMIIYVPQTLRQYESSRILRDYWRTAHGGGKIRCGIMLHRYLGLHCTVTDEALDAVRQQMPKVALPDTDVYDFKPEGVENVNQKLVVSNKMV